MAFAQMYELPPALARLFDRMIEAMDNAYLEWLEAERVKNAKKKTPPPQE